MSTPRAICATLAALALVGVLAGCGGSGSSKTGAAKDTTIVTAPPGGGDAKVTIEAHDVYFTPKKVQAPTGKLDITYEEAGSQQHTLVIQGVSGFKLEVGPGQKTATATVTLQPGQYTYYCTIPGHRAQGMQGTITVAS
jgi:plastocyanin